MTVLLPLALLAGLAVAVPLFLHLYRREEERTVVFPALRYLLASSRERDRRVRLRRILLLAARLALVVLIALAAARLVLPLGGSDHPPAALVVVIDNGIASAAVAGGERTLDRAIAGAREALAGLGSADRVWVVPAGEPWRAAFPRSPEEADSVLAGLEPTAVLPDLGAALARARALLDAQGPGPRQILVFSDLPAASLPPVPAHLAGEASERSPPVLLVPSGVDPPPNRGVAHIRVGGGLPPRAGEPAEVEVEVAGEGAAGAAVRLRIGDELVAAARTDEEGRALLSLPDQAPGWLALHLELDPDALRLDDRRSYAVPVRPPPVVAVPEELPPFLAEALEALEEGGRIRTARGATSGAETLLVLAGRSGPFPGGGATALVVAPADPTLLPALNRWLEEAGVAWRLLPIGNGAEGERALAGAPAPVAGLEGVRVRTSYELRSVEPGAETAAAVLLRLADGAPWAVEAPARDGRVRILASPLTREATDLPVSAAMIPLLDRLLDPRTLSAPAVDHPAGAPLVLPPGTLRVRPPDGTLRAVDGIPTLLETGLPGIHDLLGAGDTVLARVAVNPVPEAISSRRIPPDSAAFLLGDGIVRVASAGPGWTRDVLPDRRGREATQALVWLVLLLLAVEGWLAAAGRSRPAQERASRPERAHQGPRPSEAERSAPSDT